MQNIRIEIKKDDFWSILLLAAVLIMLAAAAAHACVATNQEEIDRANSALYQVALDNDTVALQKLIDDKANLNSHTLYMHHAIHTAAFLGHTEIVKMFIENGVDVDMGDPNGLTPLHWAARNGQAEVVNMLIEDGADVNALSKGGEDLLCNGVWGRRDIEFTLGQQVSGAINCRAERTQTLEEQYAAARSDYIYEAIMKCAGMYVYNEVLGPDDVQFTFAKGLEMLNEPEVAKRLDAEGFDLEETWQGYCPLYEYIGTDADWAIDNTIKHVLYRAAATDDYTPLRWARGNGHTDIADLLLAAGASE